MKKLKLAKTVALKSGIKPKVDAKFNKLPKDLPSQPRGMSKAAAKIWDKLLPDLFEMGVVTKIDGDSLMIYCDAIATYHEAKRKIKALGVIIDNKKTGGKYRNPWLDIQSSAAKTMERYQQYFGLHPSSRAAQKQPGVPVENNPFKKLMEPR